MPLAYKLTDVFMADRNAKAAPEIVSPKGYVESHIPVPHDMQQVQHRPVMHHVSEYLNTGLVISRLNR